ncbi:MAG: alpha,alpha-trehalase TreF, partial [Bacteroidota bacterium]
AVVKPLLYKYYNTDKLDYDFLYGDFFKAVQLGVVYPDSKTFTDCTPKFAADVILEAYEAEKKNPDFDLKGFVESNFDPPPLHSTNFKSVEGRSVEDHINALWPILTREPDPGKPGGSLIPLPHSYVVPGGRFGEIYYWDSYFTLLGLQVAGKEELVRNMVDNFAYLIDNVGFIPNGNRSYFMGRSQPPFFSLMVRVLAQMKPEEDIIVQYLPQLEKEYAFWMAGSEHEATTTSAHRRVVQLEDGRILNRYWDDRAAPRAESYKEDVHLAEETGREPVQLYQDLRAACESGWDFSSRWFADGKNLATIQTTQILPVDLNALLYHMEYLIAQAGKLSGDGEKMARFGELAEQRKQAIQELFWNEEAGYFMDWNFKTQQHTGQRTLAGMYPLFLDVSKPAQATKAARVIEAEFLKDGGVVTTLSEEAGEQWDYPNGWAPLQWVTIAGLRKYGEAKLAEEIRRRWITLNKRVYDNTGKMVEKYNVIDMTLLAGGGEYDLQDGFGWSNGILLRLLSEDR